MLYPQGSRIRRFLQCAFSAASLLVCAAPAGAGLIGPVIIDDFSDTNASWPMTVSTGQPSDSREESGLTGVLGANRRTTLANGTFGTVLDQAAVTIAPGVQNGVLDYNSTLFAASDLTLVYGIDAPSFDFTGQGGIVIDFVGFDFPDDSPLQITALLTSNGNSQTVSTMVSDIGSGEVFLSFDDLAPLRGAFDLADVDDVALEFVAGPGSDFRIGTIQTRVPAPGAMALLAVGFALTIPTRRRRDAGSQPAQA